MKCQESDSKQKLEPEYYLLKQFRNTEHLLQSCAFGRDAEYDFVVMTLVSS